MSLWDISYGFAGGKKRRESGMNKKTLFIIGILTTLLAYKGIEELNKLDLSDPFDFEDDERDI